MSNSPIYAILESRGALDCVELLDTVCFLHKTDDEDVARCQVSIRPSDLVSEFFKVLREHALTDRVSSGKQDLECASGIQAAGLMCR